MPDQVGGTPYSQGFYDYQRDGSYRSACAVIPLVMELYKPESVVDVGCGIGTWLAAFMEHGVTDVLGVDGDYVPVADLRVPVERFRAHDLRTPLTVGRSFDLAICLEVAEHLPAPSAPALVDSLTELAPVVLFSAAVPGQGGVGHVNEQWPEYWIELFQARGYEAVDCVRPRVWDQPDVDFWYAQNAFLIVRHDIFRAVPALREARDRYSVIPTSLVHPVGFRERGRYADDPGLHVPRTLLRALATAAKRSVRHRLAR